MKRNIHQLEKLLSLANRLNVRKLVLLKLWEYDLVEGESLDRYPGLLKEFLPPAIKHAHELDIELVLPPDYVQMLSSTDIPAATEINSSESEPAVSIKPKITRNCLDPWNTAFVSTDGNVYPCCNIRESIGNLRDNSFESIWFGSGLARVRKCILAGNPPKECHTCSHRGMTTLFALRLKVALRGLARSTVLSRLYAELSSHQLLRSIRSRLNAH